MLQENSNKQDFHLSVLTPLQSQLEAILYTSQYGLPLDNPDYNHPDNDSVEI